MTSFQVLVPRARNADAYVVRHFRGGTAVQKGELLARVALHRRGKILREVDVPSPAAGTVVFTQNNVLAPHPLDRVLAVVDAGAPKGTPLLDRALELEERHGGLAPLRGVHLSVKEGPGRRREFKVYAAWREPRGGREFQTLLGEWAEATEREVQKCLAWGRAAARARGLGDATVTVQRDTMDERGVFESRITRIPSPDGRFELEATFAVEPPWGPELHTVRVLRRRDREVVFDGGGDLYQLVAAASWRLAGDRCTLTLQPYASSGRRRPRVVELPG